MTNNEINDIDVDTDGDFDKGVPQKASFKETWDTNPMLKIGAIGLGAVIVIAGYMSFMAGGDDLCKTVVGGGDDVTVKADATEGAPDAVYKQALDEQNKANLDAAAQSGGSYMPQNPSGIQDEGIQVPVVPTNDKTSPLDEWRNRVEATRIEMEEKAVEEDNGLQPEVVPLVTPVRPQATMKQDPAVGQRLAEQMRVIITAQMPAKATKNVITNKLSAYEEYLREIEEQEKLSLQEKANGGDGNLATDDTLNSKTKDKVIVAAGSILYAQLLNELNSDVEGPALAAILSGPFRGGRALGTFERKEEYLTLTFDKIIKEGVVYRVDGIALDEDTTLPAHQSDVDHHYWARVILPAAAAFIQGYASAVAETGTETTTTAGGGVATSEPEPDAKEEMLKGVESAAGTISSSMEEESDVEITVVVAKGTTMGILFMDSITTEDAE